MNCHIYLVLIVNGLSEPSVYRQFFYYIIRKITTKTSGGVLRKAELVFHTMLDVKTESRRRSLEAWMLVQP